MTAVVLGGTSPHVELIKKLKKRGYHVVLIDYLNNSPGIEFADEHIQESTLDMEKVEQVAKEKNADLVISTCIDQANSVCCRVAERLGLPRPYSYQTSLDVTDKGRMKRIMVDSGIPTSPFTTVRSVEEIPWDAISYPAVVKPVDCNSSKGVHRADSPEEVEQYVREDLQMSRTGCAIIEGYNEGNEIQVDCFATENSAVVLMTRQKKKIVGGNALVLQSTGSIVPAPMKEQEVRQANEIAQAIAGAFDLHNTPFFYQAIVTASGIKVLEFAPRIGGGLSYYMLSSFAGVDSIEVAINSFLGVSQRVCPKELDRMYSTNLLYMKPGIFDHFEGVEELKAAGAIKDFFQMKKKGTEIGEDLRSGNRVGAFAVEAQDYDSLTRAEAKAYSAIKVMNADGENALITDFR